jgi:hypothetical protein
VASISLHGTIEGGNGRILGWRCCRVEVGEYSKAGSRHGLKPCNGDAVYPRLTRVDDLFNSSYKVKAEVLVCWRWEFVRCSRGR